MGLEAAMTNLTKLPNSRARDQSLLAKEPLEVMDFLLLVTSDGFRFSNDLQFSN